MANKTTSPSSPPKADSKLPDGFLETRKKGSSPVTTTVFTLLRLLNLPLQYHLLSSGLGLSLINRLGGTTIIQPSYARNHIPFLHLAPYHILILCLTIGSALKQIYYSNIINQQIFPLSSAMGIAFANTVSDTINTLLCQWKPTSQQPQDQSSLTSSLSSSSIALRVGLLLYLLGLFVEWYSEVQRSRFKDRPENAGKPYSGGLFGLARNINYGGYTVWRTGAALICGGWIWGIVLAILSSWKFYTTAIPSMDAYCEQRYGKQWEEVRRKVPYTLLPWIY